MIDTDKLVQDFITVAELAGAPINKELINVEYLQKPHKQPKSLANGKMAVYVFIYGDLCLKVGKVGTKSGARYTSQHYNPKSSNSNLSKSILKNIDFFQIKEDYINNIGAWVKESTDRINFILDSSVGMPVLSLLESFLQCQLRPIFEGFKSQK